MTRFENKRGRWSMTMMTRSILRARVMAGLLGLAVGCPAARGQISLPADFEAVPLTNVLNVPTAFAFAPDGRIFVAEQRGIVKVIQDGQQLPDFFIDLRAEVNHAHDRGMLGIALDPNFVENRYVYLSYVVDPIFGEPNESAQTATFSRVTRYTGTKESNGGVADLSSRTVLIGATPSEGFPACWSSHSMGDVIFGEDGSLLVTHGDGARFETPDDGGDTPGCFAAGMFPPEQNIGAFRAQQLDSLAGKLLRIDPATGQGLPDNPYWDGNGASNRSKVWAYGVRNPYRFGIRPGTGSAKTPGTVYIADVGWSNYEELSIVHGGENLGWPCYEGTFAAPSYPNLNPPTAGCDTIGTPTNPGPLLPPLLRWHTSNSDLSLPPGYRGSTATGGVFHVGNSYQGPFRGAYFFGDFSHNWIRALKVDADNQFIALLFFAGFSSGPVDFAIDPFTGDICYLSLINARVYRLDYAFGPGDVTHDDVVDVNDLLAVVGGWGPCPPVPTECPGDLDGSGEVNVNDLLEVVGYWD